jgi:hypothetical protein
VVNRPARVDEQLQGRAARTQTVVARRPHDAHRHLGRGHRLEKILSVREPRSVASDYTVSWQGQLWGVRRDQVCAGLRGARVEMERRLDGSHWLRFRGRYLPLFDCPAAQSAAATPLEDISIWQKTGHFYFALTQICHPSEH